MDIFGDKWANHVERLRESFSHLTADDVTVLAGDLSWGLSLIHIFAELRYGLGLQMLLYLFTLRDDGGKLFGGYPIEPAGVL